MEVRGQPRVLMVSLYLSSNAGEAATLTREAPRLDAEIIAAGTPVVILGIEFPITRFPLRAPTPRLELVRTDNGTTLWLPLRSSRADAAREEIERLVPLPSARYRLDVLSEGARDAIAHKRVAPGMSSAALTYAFGDPDEKVYELRETAMVETWRYLDAPGIVTLSADSVVEIHSP